MGPESQGEALARFTLGDILAPASQAQTRSFPMFMFLDMDRSSYSRSAFF